MYDSYENKTLSWILWIVIFESNLYVQMCSILFELTISFHPVVDPIPFVLKW